MSVSGKGVNWRACLLVLAASVVGCAGAQHGNAGAPVAGAPHGAAPKASPPVVATRAGATPKATGSGGSVGGSAANVAANLLFNLLGQVLGNALTATPPPDCSVDILPGTVDAEGRVWMLQANGTLCSAGEGEEAPRPEPLPETALALCPWGETLGVLTGQSWTEGTWYLRRLERGQWRGEFVFNSRGDRVVALDCGPERVTVLTSKHVFIADRATTRVLTLSTEVPARPAALHVEEDAAYVSLGAADGGVQWLKVDLRDGLVVSGERVWKD